MRSSCANVPDGQVTWFAHCAMDLQDICLSKDASVSTFWLELKLND